MLKILHTSDWHLGHVLYGNERIKEHKSMLMQLRDIVKDEKPDLLLVCGDIFHVSQPSATINKIFVEAISEIQRAHEDMVTLITAGNHDSGTRHEVFTELWKNFGVHTLGTLHSENPEEHIIPVKNKGYVIALPYVHSRLMPETFIQDLLNTVKDVNKENLPVVMTAHTSIRNSKFKGHEDVTDFSVGGIDMIELSDMGEGYDYLALGHIHQRQFPDPTNKKVRYSGSPMSVSFDEDRIHTVSIVKINSHNSSPEIEEREIFNPMPLITLPAEGSTDWETVKELVRDFPKEQACYLRLNVEVEDFLNPGSNEEIIKLLKGKKAKFCLINTERKKKEGTETEARLSVQDFKKESPLELFQRFLKENDNRKEEYINLFKEVLIELETEKE